MVCSRLVGSPWHLPSPAPSMAARAEIAVSSNDAHTVTVNGQQIAAEPSSQIRSRSSIWQNTRPR